jgi:hypothetical protein
LLREDKNIEMVQLSPTLPRMFMGRWTEVREDLRRLLPEAVALGIGVSSLRDLLGMTRKAIYDVLKETEH